MIKVLVTGATGRTGMMVAEKLVAEGISVRAMVRKNDERSEKLKGFGAEVVIGDFSDYHSLVGALEGVEVAYFCYPVAAGIAEAAGLFAGAGKATGLKRVVNLSIAAASPDHLSPHGRASWVAEQLLDSAGFDVVHLRVAAFFMELLFFSAPSIQQGAVMANGFGHIKGSWIASNDVAAMAVNLILHPEKAKTKVIMPTGDKSYSYYEIADLITRLSGKKITYHELNVEDWRAQLEGAVNAGIGSIAVVAHMIAIAESLRDKPGYPANDLVFELTGKKPVTLETFLQERISWFTPKE